MTSRSPVSAAPSFGCVAQIGGAKPVDRLVDVGVGHLGDRLLERELAEIHQLEFREHLEGERIGEVARAGEDLVDLRLVLGQPDRRLKGRPLLPLRQRLAARVGNGLLHHLGHHRAAIDFAQMLLRHVTGPEALDAGPALELVEPRREAPLKLVSADHHLQLTAQTVRSRFRDIHSASIHWFKRRLGAAISLKPPNSVVQRRWLVRAEGVEPPRPKPPEPKSGVSTSFTTPALRVASRASTPRSITSGFLGC